MTNAATFGEARRSTEPTMRNYYAPARGQVSTGYTSHKAHQGGPSASAEFDLVERFTGHPIAVSALHEAAHAVVATALGVAIESVSIGLPRPCMNLSGGTPLAGYVGATIAAAGLVADRWNEPDKSALYFGPSTDESLMVASIVHTLFGGVACVQVHDGAPALACEGPTRIEQIDPQMVLGDVFNAVGIAAWQILRSNRAGVDALARALLTWVTLTGTEARPYVRNLVTFTHEQLKMIVETEARTLAEAS